MMKVQSTPDQYQHGSEVILGAVSDYTSLESIQDLKSNPGIAFSTLADGQLFFNGTPETVAEYLDDHQGWFARCASPMTVQPIGKNGYELIIGRFGAFGYEVEPKVGLEMKPQRQGVYTIESIALPDAMDLGYDVDFRSMMALVAMAGSNLPSPMTCAQWQLDLKVRVRFPQFIYRLPMTLIQTTGDRLLAQIVRQVSHCLNQKIVKDFHTTYSCPLPVVPKRR